MRAVAGLARAERLFARAGDTRGTGLCESHPLRAKTAQRESKAPPS
jgi:hypothetical protein